MYRFVKFGHLCTYTNMCSRVWSCYGNVTYKHKHHEDYLSKICKENKSNSTWKTSFFIDFCILVYTGPIITNFDETVDKKLWICQQNEKFSE